MDPLVYVLGVLLGYLLGIAIVAFFIKVLWNNSLVYAVDSVLPIDWVTALGLYLLVTFLLGSPILAQQCCACVTNGASAPSDIPAFLSDSPRYS
jgi:hypothetical protein